MNKDTIVLGGGLAGLAAGHTLSKAGCPVSVFERDQVVGGLSRTIERNGFRFDLGGHRFHTHDAKIDSFIRDLMGSELISVQRSSKIHMRGKYFDYPLKPLNAMFGLGLMTTAEILADYLLETVRNAVRKREPRSLEDWVVSNFGRTMFDLYFREYSEKVWGLACNRICATWVAQRIKGLSLAKAIQNAFFKYSGRDLATLTDSFVYPALGIGRIADRLREEIETRDTVATGAEVLNVNHDGFMIESITVRCDGREMTVPAGAFISSIPLTRLISMLDPAPPARILEAASKLAFRDLVVVAVMTDRERITDQTWIYVPEQKIPFGRIHEPTNWSPAMAPSGKSLLVMEFFSSRGDRIWTMRNDRLIDLTVDNLVHLGFLGRQDVIDSMVVRVPNAYPLFTIGYHQHAEDLLAYLDTFSNLHVTGRSGMFRYYNMDVAIRSGIEAAEMALRRRSASDPFDMDELVMAVS